MLVLMQSPPPTLYTAKGSGYLYTSHLVALDQCKPQYSQHLPEVMQHIQTPLVWESWKAALSEHPD